VPVLRTEAVKITISSIVMVFCWSIFWFCWVG
jgi:hypothetical protein